MTKLELKIGGVYTTASVVIVGFVIPGREDARKGPLTIGRGFRPEAFMWLGDKFVFAAGPLRDEGVLRSALTPRDSELDDLLGLAHRDPDGVEGRSLYIDLPEGVARAAVETPT